MKSNPYIKIIERIVNSPRKYVTSRVFLQPTRICLLDFVGMPQWFITEFGAIWSRDKVYPNKFNVVTRGYLPTMIRDYYYPYPWVLFPGGTSLGWVPVNQLLGWAFDPPKTAEKCYYLSRYSGTSLLDFREFHWETELPEDAPSSSPYIDFMNTLYGV